MRCYIFLIVLLATEAAVFESNRRSLIPKTLAQKLCEKDSTLTICSLPVATPPKNPISVWKMCEDHPYVHLCQYKPPNRLPMLMINAGTVAKRLAGEVDAVESRRHLLVDKMIKEILNEKDRREEDEDTEDPFDDSIMISKSNIFDESRLRR